MPDRRTPANAVATSGEIRVFELPVEDHLRGRGREARRREPDLGGWSAAEGLEPLPYAESVMAAVEAVAR